VQKVKTVTGSGLPYSAQAQSSSPGELGKLIRERKFFIPKDRMTPVPEKKWLDGLKAELNIFDPKELRRKIREEAGYDFEGMLGYLGMPREAAGSAESLYLHLVDSLESLRHDIGYYSGFDDKKQHVANLKSLLQIAPETASSESGLRVS
jgi:hypothetical protein